MAFRRVLPFVMLALAACGSAGSDTQVTDTPMSSVATTPSTTVPSTIQSTVPPTTAALSMSYTFHGLDGLVAVEDPHLDTTGYDETTTAWSSAGGITEAFATLRDVPKPVADSPEGDSTATRIDSPSGRLWLVTDNVEQVPPPSSASRTMWWRDDGRLWIVSNYGLTPERLTALTLAIELGPDGLPTLTDPSMTLVGTSSLNQYQSIRQGWTFNGQPLTIAITNGGLAQQLNDLTATSIVEHTIAGKPGYKVTLPNGQVNLIWPTDDPTRWASVTSGPPLADSIDDIAAAIVQM